ncbi:hypothetical protein Acsp05_18480 [Actinokineospora sp. NBRC 105648]|nr:hypothetical protein Acsp05_18480 [Actinokineospora sp. NBRC 105648]
MSPLVVPDRIPPPLLSFRWYRSGEDDLAGIQVNPAPRQAAADRPAPLAPKWFPAPRQTAAVRPTPLEHKARYGCSI